MKKIILFDMDGTLVDSTEAIYESFCAVFRAHNMPILAKAEVARYIGYTLQDMFAFFGAESSEIEAYCEEYKWHYRKISVDMTEMLPTAREAVLLAARFANLGIVTTKTSAATKMLLSHFGIMEHFSVIIGREDATHTKPHKEPIINALRGLESALGGLPRSEEIFMIGDTILDLQAAKSAGIVGVGILCGYGVREDLEKFSKNIFSNPLEAVRFVEGL